MSGARQAEKPRAKFTFRIMALVSCLRSLVGSRHGRRGPFREVASEATRHRRPRTRAFGDAPSVPKAAGLRARLASRHCLGTHQSTELAETFAAALSCFLPFRLGAF